MDSEIRNRICSLNNLYKAMIKSKSGVIWKESVAKFVINSLLNCYNLKNMVFEGKYEILPYTKFTLHCPKTRHIESTRMRDRVFQRSLCDNYLYDQLTKNFVKENCSSQKGKGTDYARDLLVSNLKEFYEQYGLNGYFLKCDIKDFYGSTKHSVAKDAVEREVDDQWAKEETFRIIDSFNKDAGTDMGMGLGSQITQLVQLAILSPMDHIITEQLNVWYVRYNDDFILISPDKEYLWYCKEIISAELEKLHLKLSQKKTQVFPITQPVHFLGFSFKLHNTGRVTLKLLADKMAHERRKLRKQVAMVKEGIFTKEKVDKCYESWRAHAKRGHSRGQLAKMDRFYKSLGEEDNG